MSIHLLHKNTFRAGYIPKPEDLEVGQLGITIHTGETALWTKDTADQIVKLSGGGSATFYNTGNLGLENGPATHPGGVIIPPSEELAYQDQANLWFQECLETLDANLPLTFGAMPGSGRYVGDLHVDYDDKLHAWNGGAWVEISGGGGVEIWEGAARPGTGTDYGLWFDTTNNVLMVKLADGSWVPCSPEAEAALPANDGKIGLIGGDGIDVSGDEPTANQKDDSATIFKVDVGDGIAIDGGKVILDPDYAFPEAPDDGQIYGRDGQDKDWKVIVTDGSKVWVVEAGEDSPTAADGAKLGDLMYRPAEDRLYVARLFDVTGAPAWTQVLADSGGGPVLPEDGPIQTVNVTAPVTKKGPATDPVIGVDLSDVEDRLDALEAGGGSGGGGFSGSWNDLTDKPDIPEKTSELTNDSGFITAADVPDTSGLEARVASLEGELATLKDQMAKVLQAGDKIVGAMTTPDSGPDDAAFNGNVEIQL